MATNEEILSPKVLIVPTIKTADDWANCPAGSLFLSGAKLFVAVTKGVLELVTSS